ncbi:UNVERIFIED_CONTAM: hypothetical protein Sangu_2984500 [Sesamum angustifolium]|uniref:PiggyBac transposable element-derived protein domain-containing protein n=1 Tax=Sesamum angustifolium TaxID=2727405 RepID=A0AAW2IJG1_9LAMI
MEDSPDIIARLFRIKHKQLMILFREKKFFGNVLPEIDNRWNVPYNRDASPNSTKCMYKYTYKGIGMATIIIENNIDNPKNNGEQMYRHVDEIKQYSRSRPEKGKCYQLRNLSIKQLLLFLFKTLDR